MTSESDGLDLPLQIVSSDDEERLLRRVVGGPGYHEYSDHIWRIAADPALRVMYEDLMRAVPRGPRKTSATVQPVFQPGTDPDDVILAAHALIHHANTEVHFVVEFGMSLADAAALAAIPVEEARERLDRAVYWQARYIERRIEEWPTDLEPLIQKMRAARKQDRTHGLEEAKSLISGSDDIQRDESWKERPLLPGERTQMAVIHDFIVNDRAEDEAAFRGMLGDEDFRTLATCALLVWAERALSE